MFKIGNYPKDYDLSLLNTIYHFPSKQEDGKYSLDAIDLIIKDNQTGEKFLETIESPEYEYYMIKPEIAVEHNMFFEELENCERITTPYSNLLRDIAERTGNMNFFMENIYNGNRSNNLRLHLLPRVMNSDSNIEDHYRWKFSRRYTNRMSDISKAFLDIEVDYKDMEGDFVKPGECPINAVSLINLENMTIYIFCLRDRTNPLIQEFEDEVKSGSINDELRDFIFNHVGDNDIDKIKKYRLDEFVFNFSFFDIEIEMISSIFDTINVLKPDFLLVWNMAFDIPYFIERIKKLGFDPVNIICHPDFKYKKANYFVDTLNSNEFAERNDYASISSYTVYIDQLIQFASRRKGSSAIEKFNLDYIGEITCGVKKVDYHHITDSLANLPRINYKMFIFYNIIDTIVQHCIEHKVNDIGNVYNNVLLNNTRYSKIYRQTVYLHNRAIKSFYNSGFIMGNNCNKDTPKTKFPGAWVSDPMKTNDYSKLKINNRPISVYDNLNDFDYKSLYPSITSEFNMSPNTIICHINIPQAVYKNENRFGREEFKWKREGQFIEDYQSHVWLEFFNRWFNLASYSEMYDDVIEYFTYNSIPNGVIDIHNPDGSIPFYKVLPDSKMTTRSPYTVFLSEDDEKLYNGTKENNYRKFPFNTLSTKNSFTEVYENIQMKNGKNSCYNRKGDIE